MATLEHLIDHYTRFADGLPCSLVSPVGKMSAPTRSPGKLQDQKKVALLSLPLLFFQEVIISKIHC